MVIPQLKIPHPANFGGTGQKAVNNKKKLVHRNLPPEITNYDLILGVIGAQESAFDMFAGRTGSS